MNPVMNHIVAGFPSLEECEELAVMMAEEGASYIEIQIPFSDPIADGPTIMQANQQSLDQGTTVEDCFQLMARIKDRCPDTPLLFMSYFNIPFRYGLEKFCQRAKELGCYGLIIPDIPVDEEPQEHYLELCGKYDLHAVQVVSPITPERRLKKIGEAASGMVYCVSHTGTTGMQKDLSLDLSSYLKRVRQQVSVPLALGFGISSPEMVKQALEQADIAVIGSAVLKKLQEVEELEEMRPFLRSLITS